MNETEPPKEPARGPGIERLEAVVAWLRRQDLGMIDPATVFVARIEPEA
jgi:hypothetical protein